MSIFEKRRLRGYNTGAVREKRETRQAGMLLLPYALLFSLFILIPVVIAIGLSFTYFDVINKPDFTGLMNYIYLFTQDTVFMKKVLPNTFLYALIVGPGGYAISFWLAWMLLWAKGFGRKRGL